MKSWRRQQGLAVVIGAIVGIVNIPLYAMSYFATPEGLSSLEAPWVAAWHGVLAPFTGSALHFASPEVVYLTYGKVWTFMFLAWLIGLWAVHQMQKGIAGSLERWGYRVAVVGVVLSLLGSLAAYWVSMAIPSVLDASFFTLIVPGLLLTMVGVPLFGIGTLRARTLPRRGAWLLTVGGFPLMIGLVVLAGQISAGFLLTNVGWILLGRHLWRTSSAAARGTIVAGTG